VDGLVVSQGAAGITEIGEHEPYRVVGGPKPVDRGCHFVGPIELVA
jgi:hypothetical protein